MQTKHVITLMLCISILFGCTKEHPKETIIENQSQQKKVSNKQIANHLSDVAQSVPGVNEALVTIIGSYAIVGIDVESQLDSSRVGTIKYSVTEALRKDPHGKTAVVIADPDITTRIQQMNNNMREGDPMQAIIDEVSSIVGRTMPLFPKKEPTVHERQEKEMTPSEEQDLRNIQKKHSHENE